MAQVSYPSTLPGPQPGSFAPRSRRAASSLDGPLQQRARQRDAAGLASQYTYTYTHEEMAVWLEWWRTTLLDGKRWFAHEVPGPGGLVRRVVRYLSAQQSLLGVGIYRVSASFEQRGAADEPATARWRVAPDPRNPGNTYKYRWAGKSYESPPVFPGPWRDTLDEAVNDGGGTLGDEGEFENQLTWSHNKREMFGPFAVVPGEADSLYMHWNAHPPTNYLPIEMLAACPVMLANGFSPGPAYQWALTGGFPPGFHVTGTYRLAPFGTGNPGDLMLNNCTNYPIGPGGFPQAWLRPDALIEVLFVADVVE